MKATKNKGMTDQEVIHLIKNQLDEFYDDELDYFNRASELGLKYNAKKQLWFGEFDFLG